MRITLKSTARAILFVLAIASAPVFAQMPNPKVNQSLIKTTTTKTTLAKTITVTPHQIAAPASASVEKKMLRSEFGFKFAEIPNNSAKSVLYASLKKPQSDRWTYTAPTARKRAIRYADRVVGPFTLLGVALTAGIAHRVDFPDEWENDFKGYARRFGSALAENAIEETVVYGLDETFRIDSSFYKKGKGTKFGDRVANTFISPFTARTRSGNRVPGVPRAVGKFSSRIIAYETWYPKRFDYKDGLRDAGISFGFDIVTNLFREFILPGGRKD